MKEKIKSWVKNHKKLSIILTIVIAVFLVILLLFLLWNGSRVNSERQVNLCTQQCVYSRFWDSDTQNYTTYSWSWNMVNGAGGVGGRQIPFPTQDSCIKYCMASSVY